MTKVVINSCWGGFGLSEKGFKRYQELGGKEDDTWYIKRDDPALVQTVEELKEEAGGDYAKLEVV